MSMRSYFTEGYGFTVNNVSDKKIIEFLTNHINTFIKIMSDFKKSKTETKNFCKKLNKLKKLNEVDEKTYEEIQEFLKNFSLENLDNDQLRNTLLDIISLIIETETKIPLEFFASQEDCIGSDCMMIRLDMPWNFPVAFRNIDRKTVNIILMKYNKELNGKHTEDLDYHEIESYG